METRTSVPVSCGEVRASLIMLNQLPLFRVSKACLHMMWCDSCRLAFLEGMPAKERELMRRMLEEPRAARIR